MNKYFVHAMEQTYHGLHGIETYFVAEANLEEELYEAGEQASREVMESYSSIMEDLWEAAENDEELLESEVEINIEYYIYKIKDNVTLSMTELDSLACSLGADLFIKEYCESH